VSEPGTGPVGEHAPHPAGPPVTPPPPAWAPPRIDRPPTQPLPPPGPPQYPGYGYVPAASQPHFQPHSGVPAPAPAAPHWSRMRIGLAGLVAGALIGGGAGAGAATLLDAPTRTSGPPAAGQNVVIENPETATTATAAAAKATPSVVTVYVSSGSGGGSGSGVVLTDDGYVLTNNHVVAEGGIVQVRTAAGSLYEATIVGTDPTSDLAVLRLDGAQDLTPATFADSDEVQVGDVAVAIGAPLGLANTVTDGIISATERAVATGGTPDEATVIDAIQTDAAINPGNSGGALVNGAGEVIGINTAIATVASGLPGTQGQSGNIGVGFAIPSNHAERIAREIIATGSATRAFLGVSARTATDRANSEVGTGAEVVQVEPDSAAAEAGLRAGDVITAVGDRSVSTSAELTAAIRSQAPGEDVELTVRRRSGTETVEVTLGSTG
jgi:S1-C subfamily serine protease